MKGPKRLSVLEHKVFHEVKVFDKKEKVKKILSRKKLSKNYWDSFYQMGELTKKKGKKCGQKTSRLVDFDDENLSSDS